MKLLIMLVRSVSGRLVLHHARGEIGINKPIEIESILSTHFNGRVVDTTTFGEYDAIIPEVEGRAWLTGHNEFWIDADDPLREGFVFR
jgi:trans-L-3-hydroxyproline dehydratase